MNNKKKNTIYTLFGKIGDILLIPIFVLSFFVSSLILFQNKSDTVPSVFGVSIVKILSGSMEKSGFHINESVIISKTNTKKLWGDENGGDIIAFFNYADDADKSLHKVQLTSLDQEIEVTANAPTNRKTLKDLQGKKYRVYFHQIVGVYADETGARYFKTKGTSNASADINLIREDFVIGKYVNTPQWIRGAIKWLASPTGMICCVCIPLGILVILQALALIEQVNFMYVERKLCRGEMDWQDYEAQRLIKTGDMEQTCKIIYYSMVDENEREELKQALWIFPNKMSKKQQQEKNIVDEASGILEIQGKEKYLEFWKNNLKWNWDKKRIEEEINAINLEKINKKINVDE